MKVVFIQPGQFLRSAKSTNPFFDPLIETAVRAGIEWEIWLPRDSKSIGYSCEHVHHYDKFVFWGKWFWRIAHMCCPLLSVARVHYLFGCLARPFCRSWREADLVINIGNVFANELAAIRKNARIAEVQHGIIYSSHPGYFVEAGLLRPELRCYSNYSFWCYGSGYADCFRKNPNNGPSLPGRLKVIGDVARGLKPSTPSCQPQPPNRRLIVLVNQMTPDINKDACFALKKLYERWLDEIAGIIALKVVLRNHPRFGNIVDLSDWKVKYPWLGVDQRPFDQVFPESICCVTINSTTVFDAIPYGCPSVLIDGSEAGWKNIMVDEYGYPYGKLTVPELLEMTPTQLTEMQSRLQDWYNTFYTPFDFEQALGLIKGER